VRFYAGDGQPHRYYADDVTELGRHAAVTPVCQEGRFYPWRHNPELIGDLDLPEPGLVEDCPSCSVWARRNRHSVLIRGEVFG
jgi:hypothetical protein